MANIKQVAELAGVSVATVSRVINRSGYVSPELQERVFAAMRELNYELNVPARSLRSQETRIVGVLVPQLDHPFFSALSFVIEKTFAHHGYNVFICSAEEDASKEEDYTLMMLRQRVDGVIIGPTGYSETNFRRLIDQKIPVVLVDRDFPELEVNRVVINNFKGGYDGARYLLELGHKHVGVIGAHEYSGARAQRTRGVLQAFADFAPDTAPILEITNQLQQFDQGYDRAKQLCQQNPHLTAIFALTDVLAVGALRAASELGLRVPQDLSIIGFDDISLASFVVPPLTTVAQPISAIGETAAHILLRRMDDSNQSTETIKFETKLVVRESTASPPKD
jgi:DNA-binding LacI/PurR family transcriptional regulator